ncbi:MAG: twin-arginine translocase TatA/TatE family subunit [Blastocatellia bacterium]
MSNFMIIFFGGLGPTELVVVLVIVLLLFGGTKLPQLAKGLGEGVRNFKKAVSDDDDTPKGKLEDKTS